MTTSYKKLTETEEKIFLEYFEYLCKLTRHGKRCNRVWQAIARILYENGYKKPRKRRVGLSFACKGRQRLETRG